MILLQQIAEAEQRQAAEDQDRDDDDLDDLGVVYSEADQQHRHDTADREDDEARRERHHQRFHGTPRAIRLPCFFRRSLLVLRPKDDNRYATQFCRSAAKTAQWLWGRNSPGMALCSSPPCASQASVAWIARAI